MTRTNKLLTWTVLVGVLWTPVTHRARTARTRWRRQRMPSLIAGRSPAFYGKNRQGHYGQTGSAEQTQRYRLAASDIQTAMKTIFVTNLVVLEWEGEQEPAVNSIRMILPKTRSGVSTGTVIAVEPKWNHFDLKPFGRGLTERYQPHYDMAAKRPEKIPGRDISELKVGDKIKVTWVYDERKHPKQIQVIGEVGQKPFPKNARPK